MEELSSSRSLGQGDGALRSARVSRAEKVVMNMRSDAIRSLVKQPVVVVYPQWTLRGVADTLASRRIGAVVMRGAGPPGRPVVVRTVSFRSVTSSVRSLTAWNLIPRGPKIS